MSYSKYHARKVFDENGTRFDSAKELRRWKELQMLQKAGEIENLQRQVKFLLIPEQREPDRIGPKGGIRKGKLIERAVYYIADFTYKDKAGREIVEDTKGIRTPEYVLKRKLMLYQYNIRILET
ncbi:MAG: DUF1064 domain-containing protein [Bilifractor sp.]|jgi:hypothetical protein